MLQPVGELPASVYWRRRALVLGTALSLLGGGSWLTVAAATGGDDGGQTTASGGATPTSAPAPALDQVMPSLASVQVPTVPTPVAGTEPADQPPAAVTTAPPAPTAPAPPAEPGPCGDDVLAVSVQPEAATAAVGSTPTFTLVVTNSGPVGCVRALDAGLQEIVLVDAAGTRVWGSNDCFPEASTDTRTLAAGESVGFPVVWSGLSSEPGCTAPRARLVAGSYVLRGRLDTDLSGDTPFTLA